MVIPRPANPGYAWGFSLPSREPWPERGACQTGQHDRNLWMSADPRARARAVHLCRAHCPMLQRCLAEAREDPIPESVQGGLVWTKGPDVQPAVHQPSIATCADCTPAKLVSRPDCGTPRGHYLHRKHNEKPCRPCLNAVEAQHVERLRNSTAKCGTPTATRAHQARGEQVCEVCHLAEQLREQVRGQFRTDRESAGFPLLLARMEELAVQGLEDEQIGAEINRPAYWVHLARRLPGVAQRLRERAVGIRIPPAQRERLPAVRELRDQGYQGTAIARQLKVHPRTAQRDLNLLARLDATEGVAA